LRTILIFDGTPPPLRLSEDVEGAHASSFEEGDSAAPIQRKYQPDSNPVNSGLAQQSEYKEAVRGQLGDLGAQRGKLIVVASLIDKAPNLAGMARTCEVFQATELVVANKEKLLKDEVFKQVAVSADRCERATIISIPTMQP
jgi:tRNA G18 (ribose-2'-O)-methylase SpoU